MRVLALELRLHQLRGEVSGSRFTATAVHQPSRILSLHVPPAIAITTAIVCICGLRFHCCRSVFVTDSCMEAIWLRILRAAVHVMFETAPVAAGMLCRCVFSSLNMLLKCHHSQLNSIGNRYSRNF